MFGTIPRTFDDAASTVALDQTADFQERHRRSSVTPAVPKRCHGRSPAYLGYGRLALGRTWLTLCRFARITHLPERGKAVSTQLAHGWQWLAMRGFRGVPTECQPWA